MVGQKTRIALVGLTLALGATPAHAFCHSCNRWFGTPATAYYAPPVAVAPAPVPVTAAYAPCTACAPACTQVVNYMPQTSYRTVYVNMPVVAYQPVTAYSPCSCCPTTVMRPVTSYVMQPRLVAYTSYRPVVTAAYAPACPVAAPAVTAAYAPAVAPAAPACCGANYAPAPAVGVASPPPGTVVQRVVPQPAYAAPPQGYTVQPQPAPPVAPGSSSDATAAPPSNGAPNSTSGPNQTFQDSPPAEGQPQSRVIQPQSSSMGPNPLGAPRALDSEDQDRTTALPLRQAWTVKPASLTTVKTIQLTDESGWHRASR